MQGLAQFLRSIQGDMLLPQAFVETPRFTQTFRVPAAALPPGHDGFQLQYADVGYRKDPARPEDESVLLYFVPLGASRLASIAKDDLARSQRVRIISVDKPGSGGTTALAAAADLLPVFCDAIAALLRHLGIRSVSVASHCTGAIYALHFLLHHTEFLSSVPGQSCVFFGTPWIQVRRGTPFRTRVFQCMPQWVCRLRYRRAVRDKLRWALPAPQMRSALYIDHRHFDEQVASMITRRDFVEDGLGGLFQEVQLALLRKPFSRRRGWADWGNADTLVPRLAQKLRDEGKTLRVYTLYAEEDGIIGAPDSKALDVSGGFPYLCFFLFSLPPAFPFFFLFFFLSFFLSFFLLLLSAFDADLSSGLTCAGWTARLKTSSHTAPALS